MSLQQFIADVAQNPEHEIRKLLDERMVAWVDQLQTSPELATRGNDLKRQLLEHPEFKEWTDGIWTSIKEHITTAAEQPESDLRKRLEQLALSTGQRLLADSAVRDSVDAWISNLARHLAERSGPEVASLIATTVERWDADETSHRLELQVGRDLQFIRINGTVVGSLVGLLLHTLVETFG